MFLILKLLFVRLPSLVLIGASSLYMILAVCLMCCTRMYQIVCYVCVLFGAVYHEFHLDPCKLPLACMCYQGLRHGYPCLCVSPTNGARAHIRALFLYSTVHFCNPSSTKPCIMQTVGPRLLARGPFDVYNPAVCSGRVLCAFVAGGTQPLLVKRF